MECNHEPNTTDVRKFVEYCCFCAGSGLLSCLWPIQNERVNTKSNATHEPTTKMNDVVFINRLWPCDSDLNGTQSE